MALGFPPSLSGTGKFRTFHLTSLSFRRFITASRRARQVGQAQPHHITSNATRPSSMRPKRVLDQPSTFRRAVRLASMFSPPLFFPIRPRLIYSPIPPFPSPLGNDLEVWPSFCFGCFLFVLF